MNSLNHRDPLEQDFNDPLDAPGFGGMHWQAVTDAGTLLHRAHKRVLDAAERAIARRGRFVIVLAGGNTPRALYRSLRDAQTRWDRWHIHFGDERCLPVANPERNSAMAATEWLDHVSIPPENIHPIRAEFGAKAAAPDYTDQIKDIGYFDFVLLGLGEDGHTASLFPGHAEGLAPDAPDAVAVFNAPKPPPQRVSLSAARLSRSREVLFLIDGESKRDAVRRWRAGENIPAAAIRPEVGVDVLVEANLLESPEQ